MIDYKKNISESGLTIYDDIPLGNRELYIPLPELKKILSDALIGVSVEGLALRTRSKFVKSKVCEAFGYPIPKSFKSIKPQFTGQNVHVFTQQRLNLQMWNHEIEPSRRYVFFGVNDSFIINSVKVLTGADLKKYIKTNKLTSKYQATMKSYPSSKNFSNDSEKIQNWVQNDSYELSNIKPNDNPQKNNFLKIDEIYKLLLPMVGCSIDYLDPLQERNRGAELHKMICHYLGYVVYEDDGRYPDILNQLLEVKLQTSQTIDLGLHSPSNNEYIGSFDDLDIYSGDIRYAIFDGEAIENRVQLRKLYMVSGHDFNEYFPVCNGISSKLQINLPKNFFD